MLAWLRLTMISLGLVVFAAGQGAMAQPRTVGAGQKIELVPPGDPVITVDPNAKLKGTAVAVQSGPPTRFALTYTAPKDQGSFTEEVAYLEGQQPRRIAVSVTAPAGDAQAFPVETYSQAFKALFILFVLATLLESGLAVLFNWRPFVQLFDARGVQTVISVAVSYLFVNGFDLDIVSRLLGIFSDRPVPSDFASQFVTALVLAGGSSGVNKLLVALGFRAVKTAEEVRGKPPAEFAWISIRLRRKNAVGPVDVLIGSKDRPTVAGTISGSAGGDGLLRYFVRDFGRFPTAGGFVVKPDEELVVRLAGKNGKSETIPPTKDAQGKDLPPPAESSWGPYRLAKGAIVDLELTL